MQEVYIEQLRIVDAYSCGVSVAPSMTKHSKAGLGLSATKTRKEGDVIGTYYETTVCRDISSLHPTRKLCSDRVLKVDVERLSKFAMQLKIQEERFDRVTERLDNGKAQCTASWLFSTNNYRHAKENREFAKHQKKLVPSACSRNMVFHQNSSFLIRLSDNYVSCLLRARGTVISLRRFLCTTPKRFQNLRRVQLSAVNTCYPFIKLVDSKCSKSIHSTLKTNACYMQGMQSEYVFFKIIDTGQTIRQPMETHS